MLRDMQKPPMPPKPKRKRLNAKDRRALKAAGVQLFIRATGRKKRPGLDPNDRHIRRKDTLATRRMKPEKLDQLIRDGEDEDA
ncbi:MAG: hypothetical protein ACYCZX_11000 [Rhodospirillaceae bacterium]